MQTISASDLSQEAINKINANFEELQGGEQGGDNSNIGLIIGEDGRIHTTNDGVTANDTLGIKINPEVVTGNINTEPIIEYDGFGRKSNGDTVAKANLGLTKKYKLKLAAGKIYYKIGSMPSHGGYNRVGFYNDGTYVSQESPTIGADKSMDIPSNVNEVSMVLDTRYLDGCYLYEGNSGYIHFAGKNTKYYGYEYISEAPSGADYGEIGSLYPNQVEFIEKVLSKGLSNRFAFCHVSDTHGYDISKICEFVDNSPARFLVVTGDMLSGNYEDDYTPISTPINNMQKHAYVVTGNHDVSHSPSNQATFNKLFAPIQEHNGQTELDKTYYSVDFTVGAQTDNYHKATSWDSYDYGFKCIFLDCYDGFGDNSDRAPGSCSPGNISQEQINWFFDELQDAIDRRLNVIVFMHQKPAAFTTTHDFWHDGYPANYVSGSSFYDFITDIINAFKGGNDGTVTFEYKGVPYSHTFEKNTNANAYGSFVGYFTGHTHLDQVGYIENYKTQLNVTVASPTGGNSGGYDTTNRESGLHLTFNYVVVDKMCRTISIYRIGCQDTVCGIKRDLFVGKWY